MKRLFKIALIAICILFTGGVASAQIKIGYVNFDAVKQLMPELKTITTQINAYQHTLSDGLPSQQATYTKDVADYHAKMATMTDAVRIAKEAELADEATRIGNYQQTVQQQVDAKLAEYMKPLSDKIHAAITAVASNGGYTYVYNSVTVEFFVAPAADDLTAAVEVKLGLK